MFRRNGVWYADGRSQAHKLGRHTLGTRAHDEARRALADLDRQKAEELGLIPRSKSTSKPDELLLLAEGRRLYELNINRPVVTGGLQNSTKKKYRSHLDKLIDFLTAKRVVAWNYLNAKLLNEYAAFLKQGGPKDSRPESYSDKSVLNELTFAKQLIKCLIDEGH